MAHGGKREGSGRKKGIASILSEKTRAYIAERVVKEQEALITAQIEKAKTGDTHAFNSIMDRAFGKPTESVEMSGPEGEPLLIDDNQYKQLLRAAVARIANDKSGE